MKIEKVILKESEIVKVDGEFKQIFKNQKEVPCFLTNYSLKRGKDLGLLNGSLIADVMKLIPLTKLKSADDIDPETMRELDEIEMMKVIYVGCIGANKNLDLGFDEFVSLYHDSYEDTLILYTTLISGLIQKDPNQFAKGLKNSTKQHKKKYNPHKSKSNA
ncbi:hypothetical protein [Neobacillus niacini]|uniref:hypothetical protein n=1 Tax=Neobacillus niacini TaxID=86668 RepID=UPI002FFEDCF3